MVHTYNKISFSLKIEKLMCLLKDGLTILQEHNLRESCYNPSTKLYELNDSSFKMTL